MVYTKPRWEKKVATTLTKRKFENFYPVNSKSVMSYQKIKIHQDPLFECCIFVNAAEGEISKIRMIEGVMNLVYWKGKPAIVQADEIELIRDFTNDHQNIQIEKTKVNLNDVAKVIDGSKYSIAGNVLTVKNTRFKVNLPSIGYTLAAQIETITPLHREVIFGEKGLFLQS